MRKRGKIMAIYKPLSLAILPFLFEILDNVTGEWYLKKIELNFTTVKIFPISIAIILLGHIIYYTCRENSQRDEILKKEDELKEKDKTIIGMKKELDSSKESIIHLRDLFIFMADKFRDQIKSFKKEKCLADSYMNNTGSAAAVCSSISNNISRIIDRDKKDVSVNYYIKYSRDGNCYTKMISKDGYDSKPKYYTVERMLKINKKSQYCERLLADDNPDIVFLKNKEEVMKAFKVSEKKKDNFKYNQYVGIPVQRAGSNENIALIEIVAHNDTKIWEEHEEARSFLTEYCEPFREFITLIDEITRLHETINDAFTSRKEVDINADSSIAIQESK